MLSARKLAITAFALLAALFISPVQAYETGTAAWTLKPLTLRDGPGRAYQVTGEIGGDLRIRVDRCSDRWCQIHGEGERGWVSIDHLSFGRSPLYPLEGIKLGYNRGGPGKVCLYEGTHFTGTTICAKSGTVLRDLKLNGYDNMFSSVTVEGNVSVTLCRDRNFTSYCRVITEDESSLEGFLNNNLTSVRVY